jgi:tetratricopeptide (TPR) repeat protein
MPSVRNLLLAAAAATALLLATPPAAAADRPADKANIARQHYESGLRKFNVGKFAEAAEDFQAAYEVSGRDSLLFNIAQAWRQAKNYEKALFFYKAYMASFRRNDQWPPDRALIEERIQEATDQLAARPATPAPTTEPKPTEPATPPAATTAPPVAVATTPATRTPASPPPRWMRPVGIGLVAVGAGALVGGGVLSALAGSASSDVEKAHGEFTQSLYDTQQRGLTFQAAGIGLFVAGGVLVVAGAVPLALSLRKPRAYAVAPSLAPTSAGLVMSGRY